MEPGELDRRVVFYRDQVTGRTDKGGPITTEVEYAKAWAKKTDVRDAERVAAQQVGATISTRFQTYWSQKLAAVDPTFRLRLAGRTYEITGVKEIGTREGLEFTTTAEADKPTE